MNGFLAGFLAPWWICGALLALHALLPARHVAGYVRDPATGTPLRYRLNGPLVWAVIVAAWFVGGWTGVVPWNWLWEHRWSGALGAGVLGLVVSAAAVLTAPAVGDSVLGDLYLGRRANPRLFGDRVDAKMFLYVFGAAMLQLNLLAFAAHHFLVFPDDSSPGVVLYVVLFTWFVLDYLFLERVHLYTYDLFAERVGAKLVWGCLHWYPYFYAVGLWAVADLPNPGVPPWLLVLAAVIFFAGWTLARGANMQKFAFKRDPNQPFLGFAPRVLSDGRHRLLCGGFWGVSRHVNYLGEILMATGLALSLGRPELPGPWLYVVYYVLLLGFRERDDDRRCAEKYGALWEEYRAAVPWRIVPSVY